MVSIVLLDSSRAPLIGVEGGCTDCCSSSDVGGKKVYLLMQSGHNVYAHEHG